jgi:hypothetical protein
MILHTTNELKIKLLKMQDGRILQPQLLLYLATQTAIVAHCHCPFRPQIHLTLLAMILQDYKLSSVSRQIFVALFMH